jgi:hypothetical protein
MPAKFRLRKGRFYIFLPFLIVVPDLSQDRHNLIHYSQIFTLSPHPTGFPVTMMIISDKHDVIHKQSQQ